MREETRKRNIQYRNKYNAENYDRINLILPRGKRDSIKNHVHRTGETTNGFIKRAIDETMARDDKMENRYTMNHTPLNDNDD